MSLMKKLKTTEVDVQDRDSLGGYQLFDTDVYDFTIKMAYVEESKGGALGATLMLESPDGRTYRETIYFTNKKGETFFTNAKGETQFLPGYNLLNSITMLTIQTELAEMDTEERIVKVYDADAKAEINKTVDAFVELINQPIKLAIEKQLQDKTVKNEATGGYEPTGETQERNAITKAFHSEKLVTLTEALGKLEPEFMDKWVAKNKGNLLDKTKKDKTIAKGTPSATGTSTKAAKPKTSLFD
jgi:hypothetical protein